MKKYFVITFILYLSGCNPVSSSSESIIPNHTYHGNFKIINITDSSNTNSENGSIQITFLDTSYSYKAYYYDTTFGRGKIFKNGLHDGGSYSQMSNEILMQDSAVVYGLGTPTGSPSLYLKGYFKISEEINQIMLTNNSNYLEYIIKLEK